MNDNEIAKLRILLNHWIKHNQEHSQEFREWAPKARALGEAEVGKKMLEAANTLDKANEPLSRALRKLDKKEP